MIKKWRCRKAGPDDATLLLGTRHSVPKVASSRPTCVEAGYLVSNRANSRANSM